MQLLFGCFAKQYHISKFRKKNDRSLRATYHSDERHEILLESRTFVNHFNTSKAYLVILNLFELIYLVTGSFNPEKAHSSLFICASTYWGIALVLYAVSLIWNSPLSYVNPFVQ